MACTASAQQAGVLGLSLNTAKYSRLLDQLYTGRTGFVLNGTHGACSRKLFQARPAKAHQPRLQHFQPRVFSPAVVPKHRSTSVLYRIQVDCRRALGSFAHALAQSSDSTRSGSRQCRQVPRRLRPGSTSDLALLYSTVAHRKPDKTLCPLRVSSRQFSSILLTGRKAPRAAITVTVATSAAEGFSRDRQQ